MNMEKLWTKKTKKYSKAILGTFLLVLLGAVVTGIVWCKAPPIQGTFIEGFNKALEVEGYMTIIIVIFCIAVWCFVSEQNRS